MLDTLKSVFYWDGIIYLAAWLTAINQGFDLYQKIKIERQQIESLKGKPPKTKHRSGKKQKR